MPKLNTIPARVQTDSVGGIVKVIYDFADVGGKIGNIPLELELPPGSIIHRGFIDVVTTITSGGSATVGLSFINNASSPVAQSIYTATAIASVTGVVALTANTTPVKLAGGTKSALNLVVATADLTAGKANIYLQYFGVA
jgi:hypothetical protein